MCFRGALGVRVETHEEERPQVRVLRRTVEQVRDVVPLVPALADSVPQMVDQLVAVLARCDMPIADQVIEVPKVSCLSRCARTVLRALQTAEQLVKVPTILYLLKQLQVVVFREVFKVFPKDGLQQRVPWSRTLTFQFPEVACLISLFLALKAHPQYRVMSVGKGFFRTFPQVQQTATLPPRSGPTLPPHSSPQTPAAYDVPPTAVHTPQSLRKLVAQLMARQIRRAVDATMAARDTTVSAMRDSLDARALGPHQMGAGSAAGAQLALEDTAEMCTTDMPSALYRERVLGALATEAPFLLSYFATACHETGTAVWTRGPNGWHQHATSRGVPQRSPLSAIRFTLAFGIA